MQVEELLSEGLVLELEITVAGKKLAEDVHKALQDMAKTYKMPGFRDGNVPLSFIEKKEGALLMTKAVEHEIDASLQKIFSERNIRPAAQPVVEVTSFDEEKGLTFHAKIEIFPEVPAVKWDEVELETVSIKVTNQDFNKAYEDILSNLKNFEPAPGSNADSGDAVMIDFIGSIDGVPFEGGAGNGVRLELGSNQFIIGFESQLVGAKAGDSKKVAVTFPVDYHKKKLSGKDAVFEVKVNEVLTSKSFDSINDEVAKQLGLENVEKLNEAIKQKIEIDFQEVTRLRTKKMLFDVIDKLYNFDVPPSMKKADFDAMWEDVKRQKSAQPDKFDGKSDEQLQEEYHAISSRRVRLGLILAEIARTEEINVSDAELQYAIALQAMQNPGAAKWIQDYYKKPENIDRLRGPLLEEKVVDFILPKIKTIKKEVTSKDFFEKYAGDINAA